MVGGGFCQRSQFRGVEPAVGVGSGHVNVLRRNDQQSPARGVRKRIDFFTPADAQRGSAEQEKRDVGPEAGGNVKKPRSFDPLTGELQVAQKSRGRIAGAAAEAAPRWNILLENDFDAGSNATLSSQRVPRAVDQALRN